MEHFIVPGKGFNKCQVSRGHLFLMWPKEDGKRGSWGTLHALNIVKYVVSGKCDQPRTYRAKDQTGRHTLRRVTPFCEAQPKESARLLGDLSL